LKVNLEKMLLMYSASQQLGTQIIYILMATSHLLKNMMPLEENVLQLESILTTYICEVILKCLSMMKRHAESVLQSRNILIIYVWAEISKESRKKKSLTLFVSHLLDTLIIFMSTEISLPLRNQVLQEVNVPPSVSIRIICK